MFRRNIKYVIFFLIFINSIVGAFAFWDIVITDTNNNEIDLGDRALIEISATINPTDKLVPKGSFKGTGEIDEYVFEYAVTFNKNGDLSVVIDPASIKIGDGLHAFNHLAIVQVFIEENTHGDVANLNLRTPFDHWDEIESVYKMTVFIRVFIVAPADEADYEAAYLAIRNQKITFSIRFEALESEIPDVPED